MYTKEKLIEWTNSIISFADSILEKNRAFGIYSIHNVNVGSYSKFRDQSLRFLQQTFGEDSREYREFDADVNSPMVSYIEIGRELIAGVREDINNNRISIIGIVTADIFDDMLDMGKHLWDNGQDAAAAMLFGGVLEEHLRQLCKKTNINISIQKTGTISKYRTASDLNNDLYKAGVYDKAENANVDSLYKLRNNASHPPHKIHPDEVRRLYAGSMDFVKRYQL